VQSATFSPDGTYLATGTSGVWPADPDDCPAEIWNATTGQALARRRTHLGMPSFRDVAPHAIDPPNQQFR
jgi:hypothetical protein